MQTYRLKPYYVDELKKKDNLLLQLELIQLFNVHPTRFYQLIYKGDVRLTTYAALSLMADYFHVSIHDLVEPIN